MNDEQREQAVKIGGNATSSVAIAGNGNNVTLGIPATASEDILQAFSLTVPMPGSMPGIPGLDEPLPRLEVRAIEEQINERRPVFVSGDPGTGKSGIAFSLFRICHDSGIPVLFIDGRRYSNVTNLHELSLELSLPDSLVRCLGRIGQETGCRLIIDQLDSVASDPAGKILVDLAKVCARMNGVQVAVFSRRAEGYESRLLSLLVSAGFVELPCGELSDFQVRYALNAVGLDDPPVHIVEISKNILNLSLVAGIAKRDPSFDFSGKIPDGISLWENFIEVMINSESDFLNNTELGTQMLYEATTLACRGITSGGRTIEIRSLSNVHRRLLSWQIIECDYGNAYKFRHEKLQEFLYARARVDEQVMPDSVLNEIGPFRVRSVLPMMVDLHLKKDWPKISEFITEVLYVNQR